jgi:hypothetical protein
MVQAQCLSVANIMLRSLTLSGSCQLDSLPSLHRYASTMERLCGVRFVRKQGANPGPGCHGTAHEDLRACCDLRGHSALRYLSIYTDHKMQLQLPSTLASLKLVLWGKISDSAMHDVSEAMKRGGIYRMPELSIGWPVHLRGATGLRELRVEVDREIVSGTPRHGEGWRPVRETPEL